MKVPVVIPTTDGKGVAERIMVEVNGMKDPSTGEVFLDGEALEQLDKVKARHMGLLLPSEIKGLRLSLGLTQEQISDLLKIGEKTYSLWECGRGRPSQSFNQILQLLLERKLTISDLRHERKPLFDWSGFPLPVAGHECKQVLIQVPEPKGIYDERFPVAA
jgi:DNA-binding transcriptional regulator YiaG